jgi:flavin-dependent dehydrogenase
MISKVKKTKPHGVARVGTSPVGVEGSPLRNGTPPVGMDGLIVRAEGSSAPWAIKARDPLVRAGSSSARGESLPVQVVGASVAGLFTACLLARRGVAVDVLERTDRLEPMPRTLIVTNRMRQILGTLGEACVTNEIRNFELFTDGRVASVTLDQPDLVIERAALIRSLADSAQNFGANLVFGRRFQRLAGGGKGLTVQYENCEDGSQEERRTGAVVGGDGAASRVARAAGWPAQATASLIQAVVALPSDLAAHTVRVWFVPQDTPYFYWLIPCNEHEGVLGLIGEAGAEARVSLERFLARKGFAARRFEGGRVPIYSGWVNVEKRLGAGRVFLVGDAAAQVKVTTVGGVVTGLRGAVGVAESIVSGRGGELRGLRRELDAHLWVRRALHHFTQPDYSRLVDLLNAPARRALSRQSRDQALSVLWRLCWSEPRLFLLGLRGLLMRNGTPPVTPSRSREAAAVAVATPGD